MLLRNSLLLIIAYIFFFLPIKWVGEITSWACFGDWWCYGVRLFKGIFLLDFYSGWLVREPVEPKIQAVMIAYGLIGVGIVLTVIVYKNVKPKKIPIELPGWFINNVYWIILGVVLALEMFFWLMSQLQK